MTSTGCTFCNFLACHASQILLMSDFFWMDFVGKAVAVYSSISVLCYNAVEVGL